jgi:hypothetical protein
LGGELWMAQLANGDEPLPEGAFGGRGEGRQVIRKKGNFVMREM